MKINLVALKEQAKKRPAGYYEEVLRHGRVSGGFIEITPPEYKLLLSMYSEKVDGRGSRSGCCGGGGPNLAQVSSSFPPFINQLRNAGGAMLRLGEAAISGHKVLASAEEVAKREAICEGCEFYAKESKRCKKCGCLLRMKIKMETEHCPINLW